MLITGMSRLAHSGVPKMCLQMGQALLSTGAKYVAGWSGAVYTGKTGKITTKITMTLTSTIKDEGCVFNCLDASKKLHEHLQSQMLSVQEQFTDAAVKGTIEGDGYETTYNVLNKVDQAEEIVGSSSGSGFDSSGMF